jgi:hypothetical protein
MKIRGWINDSMSDRLGLAVVEVGANERATPEDMLRLVDGDSAGHFGVSITLVGSGDYDIDSWLREARHRYRSGKGSAASLGQFGFPNASAMEQGNRYYRVHVSRD